LGKANPGVSDGEIVVKVGARMFARDNLCFRGGGGGLGRGLRASSGKFWGRLSGFTEKHSRWAMFVWQPLHGCTSSDRRRPGIPRGDYFLLACYNTCQTGKGSRPAEGDELIFDIDAEGVTPIFTWGHQGRRGRFQSPSPDKQGQTGAWGTVRPS